MHAAEVKPYDKATFDALHAAGKPVVIHVYADWCPTCKRQIPIISGLLSEPPFKDYTVLKRVAENSNVSAGIRTGLGLRALGDPAPSTP